MSNAAPIDWACAYARHGVDVFPCAANKQPLTPNGFKDATCNLAVIEDWWRHWPHADPAWALPATVVVVDIDIKHGKNGYRDFERLNGSDPLKVETPTTSTPSGGLQLFFAAAKPYRNRVAIDGTGIDTRTKDGYVVLPGPSNGRQWLRPLRGTPMAPAPAWLDEALNTAPPPARLMRSIASRKEALDAVERACAKIIAAPRGARDDTRHRQCFFVGALIASGELDYQTGLNAMVAAARAIDGAGDWRDLDKRVAYSIERGMDQASSRRAP